MRSVTLCAPFERLVCLVAISLCTAAPLRAQVVIREAPDQISVEIDGKPFTVFYTGGQDLKRPYLHPLRSASGKIVDRSFPAGQLPGETTDHPHHAGLWYGHGDVNGYNYWAIQNVPTPPSTEDATMGRIALKRVTSVKSGKETGSVDAVFNWLKPDGKPLLTENRTMVFHSHPQLRIIDFDFDLAAAEEVVFRDTKEGTFAMRMATALEEPQSPAGASANGPVRTGTLTNAQGGGREANVWGKRSEWVDYSGVIDGERVGVVMMDHPDNPRHPTYWHSRGYGLHAINPFGVSDFLNDKTKNGSLTVAPGTHVRFRYRVVIHPGLSRENIAELYKQYASITGQTRDITVLCSNGFKAVMEELAPQFERASKRKVVVRYDLAAKLRQEIEGGAAVDVAILTPAAIDDLIKAGKGVADTRTTLARSGLGVAIRSGASKPDISTVDAFKTSLRAAKGIAYAKEGASGVAFVATVEKLGLTNDLKAQMKPTVTGEEVAEAVVNGTADFGVLPVSEILPIRGAQLLGAFPADAQSYVVMVAAAGAHAKDPGAARELITFLAAPAATPTVTAKGMERVK